MPEFLIFFGKKTVVGGSFCCFIIYLTVVNAVEDRVFFGTVPLQQQQQKSN